MRRVNATTSLNTSVGDRFVDRPGENSSTLIPVAWLNEIQEEVIGVIEGSGLTPSTSTDQLRAGIRRFSPSYEILVAPSSYLGAHYNTLSDAITNAQNNSHIFVRTSETLNSTITITQTNLHIYFHSGSEFTKGSATKGFEVQSEGVQLHGLTLKDFNATGDIGVHYTSTSSKGSVVNCDLFNNTVDFQDQGTDNHENGNRYSYGITTIANNSTNQVINGLPAFHNGNLFTTFSYYILRSTATANRSQAGLINVGYIAESDSFYLNQTSTLQSDFTEYDAGVTFNLSSSNQLRYSSNNLTGGTYSGTLYLKQLSKFTKP